MSLKTLILISTLMLAGAVMAIEEPQYDVISSVGDIELRSYAPKIVAEVWVEGDMDQASRAGFNYLANYIFGNNSKATGSSEKIAMTAPVTLEKSSTVSNEKIAMTAPVTMEKADEAGEPRWRVHFVMPSQYSIETLPTPNSSRVQLREIPAVNYAVIRFSGFSGEEKVAEKTATLLAWMHDNDLTPMGEPELARYNPPWTLPFMRRNEVMVRY